MKRRSIAIIMRKCPTRERSAAMMGWVKNAANIGTVPATMSMIAKIFSSFLFSGFMRYSSFAPI